MTRPFARTPAGALALLACLVLTTAASARTPAQVRTVGLLSLPRGSFEISLGNAPAWLPLAGTAETLTLIAGAPKSARDRTDNAYVAFVAAGRRCAATPAASRTTYFTFGQLYAPAHSAAIAAGAFAPSGGAAAGTSIASVGGVVIDQTVNAGARACIWLAAHPGTAKPSRKHRRLTSTLAGSLLVPLLNDTFAASVSNLSGATAGDGGYTMDAFDGGHAVRYSTSTTQCGETSVDGAQTVPAGTPASETVSISADPCATDASRFSFTAGGLSAALAYPISDALATPPVTVGTGACELDPLTGATLTQAAQYLAAVGCRVGDVEVSPYERTLARGRVSWAAVDGGVAELAPAGTAVDLVLNGRP